MSDTPTTIPTTNTGELIEVDAGVVATAIENGILAQEPIQVGDHTLAQPLPAGWQLHTIDQRDSEDYPRQRVGEFPFVLIRSLGQYVDRYKTDDTLGYLKDVNGVGPKILVEDLRLARYVLDDFPTDSTANRVHVAQLVLRPTAQARRWGNALLHIQNQEQMLDLIDDGIGEIAKPAAADLRELIADLHAIRTTEAQSVIRTGGKASITVADNVDLHGGKGTEIAVPEKMTILFQPFASTADTIVLDVKIKPIISDRGKVSFFLSAPALDSVMTKLVGDIAAELAEATGIDPFWTV